jgi:hypothetical protein
MRDLDSHLSKCDARRGRRTLVARTDRTDLKTFRRVMSFIESDELPW